MCGIVGIVNLDPRETVDEALLKRMRDVLRHRGPDGEGLWAEGPVGFGHRRLAIVDVAGGQQPMANEDESCWIVYNGEIYNHAALRPGLEARGHHYRTRSDTETIIHLYEEEQERCVERLRGMFAFALWDRARKRLLLARDRLGIKPLYYAVTRRELLFASEIKAILAASSRPAFNETILPEFLANRFVAGEETFFQGVRKLLPGRTLTWSADAGFETRRYWQLPVATEDGGADLGAHARELRSRLEVVVSPAEFFEALPRLVWHEDEPIAHASSVPLYFVSRLAREHVKVVLTGEGSDELFLGYNWYRVTAWNDRIASVYGAVVPPAIRHTVAALTGRLPAAARRYAERTVLALPPGVRALFYENFAVFSDARQQALLANPEWLGLRDPYAEGLRCYAEAEGGPLDRMSRADVQTYLVELLMKQDQMSMAASVESRVPFLDHELVEHALGIPARVKLRGWRTKAVLRAALADHVPRPILTRRKMGFPVPVGRWLRAEFWPVVEEFVLGPRALARGLFRPAALRRLAEEHRTGAERHGDRLWLLANLEIWHRIFLDGEDPADVGRRP